MRNIRIVLFVVVLLILAGVGGFVARSWVSSRTGPVQQYTEPAAVSTHADVPASTTVNQPDKFVFDDLQGKPHRLSDWSGKLLLVNFWATWCTPCRREIPLLKRLQKTYGRKGLQVIGIATDEPDKKTVLDFVRKMAITYPILLGNNQAYDFAGSLGVNLIGLPYSILVNAKGKVLAIHAGELSAEEANTLLNNRFN